jgi:hypothetical protein
VNAKLFFKKGRSTSIGVVPIVRKFKVESPMPWPLPMQTLVCKLIVTFKIYIKHQKFPMFVNR